MAIWNIELKTRKEVITVQKVLRQWTGHEAHTIVSFGDILDQKSRKHTISARDFSIQDWTRIKEGSRIEVEIKECVSGQKLLGDI